MNEENRKWEIMEDTDFIGSTTPEDALAGYLEFTDGVLLVCLVIEDSSGDSDSGESRSENEAAGDSWVDLDDIPF